MPRRDKKDAPAAPSPAPLTVADREFIEQIRVAEAHIHRQELAVESAAKKLRAERAALRERFGELRALTRSLPLFDKAES